MAEEITEEDRQARNQCYAMAVNVAKAEYDALHVDYKRVRDRIIKLRMLINAASDLLDIPIEEKYRPGYEAAQFYQMQAGRKHKEGTSKG